MYMHAIQRMASDYVDLHEQVLSSTSLLDSLQSFLSTFQKDLSAVSLQIANLQLQSKDIDNRLQSRKVLVPLSALSQIPQLLTITKENRIIS